jgi:hypothetical protein
MDNFIERLLSHVKEVECNHSVMDLLDELFDNKNARGTTPRLKSRENSNNLPRLKEIIVK